MMPRRDDVPMQALLKGLIVDRVDFCRAGSNGESDIVLYKRDKRIPSTIRKEQPMPENTEPTPEQTAELQKAIDDAVTAAIAKHDEDLAELAKGEPAPEPELDPIAKAVNEAVAVEVAKREKLEGEVAKMLDENLTAVMVAKAETVAHVGAAADVAAVLKAVAQNCEPAIAESLEAILKSAHERIDLSKLTKDVPGGAPAADTPYAALSAKADEFRKADPNLNQSEAFSLAAKALPAEYAEFVKSTRKPAAA